jgi:hypothetical protein
VVAVVLVGFGIVDRLVGSPTVAPVPPAVASVAAPFGSQSSTWYCSGQSANSGGVAQGSVLVANTGPEPVTGSVDAVSDAGTRGSEALTVPGQAQVVVSPSSLVRGSWVAATVELDGGAVAVSQAVQGPTGWSQSACASTALPDSYFAAGSTAPGSSLVLTLFNPMATPSVVDTTFVTAQGSIQPQPDEGLVVEPGHLVAIDVGAYVQDQPQVSSIVTARSGAIVAEELETLSLNGQRGVSLRLGAPAPRRTWTLPLTVQPVAAPGTATVLDILNPTASSETVRVSAHVAATLAGAGAMAPFVAVVAPGTTWHLRTDTARRIPPATSFALSVTATGSGVIVDRETSISAAGSPPQWGVTPAVDPLSAGGRVWSWTLPAPPTAVPGSSVAALALANLGRATVTVHVSALSGGQVENLGPSSGLRLGPRRVVVIGRPAGPGIPAAPDVPVALPAGAALVVSSGGPLAVSEDLLPAGAPGVVTAVGIPLR